MKFINSELKSVRNSSAAIPTQGNTHFNEIQKTLIDAEFSRNAKLYDSVAKVQRKIANRLVSRVIATHFKDQNDQYSILDAGCGTGYVGSNLYHELVQLQGKDRSTLPALTGLDLSQEMLDMAKSRNVYQRYQQGDIEALPFLNSSFDLVLSSLAIQWCHSPQKAISELVRVSKASIDRKQLDTVKTPRVFITTLLEGTLQELVDAFKFVDDEQHVIDFISENTLREIVSQYGGKITAYKELMRFDSLKDLFKSLKNIGATALPNRKKGLLGRESYQKIEQFFQNSGGYQLTYSVALIEIP